MVVQGQADALRFTAAVQPVLVVHIAAEDRHVGHLAAYGAQFDQRAAQIAGHLAAQFFFDPGDQVGALVVEHVAAQGGQKFAVLGIAPHRIAHLQQAHQRRGGHLRGDQVHGALLAPEVVLQALAQDDFRLGQAGLFGLGGFRLQAHRRNGPEIGRGFAAPVEAHHPGRQAPAVHLDAHLSIHAQGGVQIGQADHAPAVFVGNVHRGPAAFEHPVGHRGTTGYHSHLPVAQQHRRAGRNLGERFAVEHGQRPDAPQRRFQRFVVGGAKLAPAGELGLQGLAPQKVTLQRRKAHCPLGRWQGIGRQRVAQRIDPQFPAVLRKAGFQAQSVSGSQSHRLDAVPATGLDQLLPEFLCLGCPHEQLEPDRFARIAGPRDDHFGAAKTGLGQAVAEGLGQPAAFEQLLEQSAAGRSLQGDQGQLLGAVFEHHVGKGRGLASEVLEVGLTVLGVYRQQEFALVEAIQVGVVDHLALGVGNQRVMGPAGTERGHVVAQHVLQEPQAARPADPEPAHVAQVEQPPELARGQVFLLGPSEAVGQQPAGGRSHFGPVGLVPPAKRGRASVRLQTTHSSILRRPRGFARPMAALGQCRMFSRPGGSAACKPHPPQQRGQPGSPPCVSLLLQVPRRATISRQAGRQEPRLRQPVRPVRRRAHKRPAQLRLTTACQHRHRRGLIAR